ncbi:hypothetical protein RhiirA4_444674 [Rhizophagus irregularis]|uniref:Ion transport domain-containing protein n=1 Tax=Rhizophagus irregularis TaxID=588596 RepID=A0A2I1GKG3_9GLOM|nr:hypothetical protein RhiirA4_444674 [Rhizophagus irregularis]
MDELEKINVEETAHDVITVEEIVHDVINVVPHDGKPITKMAISPKSKYIVTYSQEDKSFVGWSQKQEGNSSPDNIDNNLPIYDKHASPEYYFQSYMDFKASDEMIIILNKDLFELSIIPYWKVLIGIYTFQYWKLLLDVNEKEINTEEIKLNFSKNLTVININGTLYIYSNKMKKMNVPIGDIDDNSVQDFGIVDDYIITTSNGNINIHSWRQNLKKSIDLNSLLESKEDSDIDFTHIEFMDNKVFLYLYRNKQWITKEYDWKYFKTLLLEDLDINSSNLKGVINNKNIFCNIEKQFIAQKLTHGFNENQFIENYIIPSLKTCEIFQKIEEQNEYNLRLKSNDKIEKEIILETVLSSNETKEIVISSYNTKLKFEEWEHKKVNNNILIFIKIQKKEKNESFEIEEKGLFEMLEEIKRFIWSPKKWILNIWNLFDLGAYLLPTITSIIWLRAPEINVTSLASISCLLLDIKFLLFFRAFETFGIYFAIIIGVGRRIFSFLFILFLIIISFAHAFFILLEPKLDEFSENNPGDLNDSNNPWVLTTKYHQISEDGKINPNAVLVQEPDEYTNLFSNYANSLLAVYLFLIGDKNSLDAWQPKDNTVMIVLMVIFTLVIVVFLMNLFIGLLNMAIEKDNDRAFYLAQKAEILKDIELFYLLPHQRRRTDWFPDIIYYYADVGEIHKAKKKLMDEEALNEALNKSDLSEIIEEKFSKLLSQV